MARTKKTVDYFPHIIKNGKTITILENKFGNDGYAFWFKLLEILGSTEGHYYAYRDTSEREFLHARTGVSEEDAQQILDLLAKLGAIDKELWEENIIWSDNFIENIRDAYSRRKVDVPEKPGKNDVNHEDVPQDPTVNREDVNIKEQSSGTMGDKKQQSKVKYSKVKDIYNHWKEKSETISHRKLTKPMKKGINARLDDGYTVDELKEAIDNYNMVVKSDDYFFNYDNWSLNEFLSRGEGEQVEKFLENPDAYLKDDNDSDKNKSKRRHSTMTEGEKEELGL